MRYPDCHVAMSYSELDTIYYKSDWDTDVKYRTYIQTCKRDEKILCTDGKKNEESLMEMEHKHSKLKGI